MTIIDLEQIEQLGGLGNEMLREILGDFLDQLGGHFSELAALLESGDRERFREASHQLKGGARTAGFPEIGELARAWEDAATDGDPLPDAADLREQLERATERARQAFEQALEGLHPD